MTELRPLRIAYLSGSPRITTRDAAGVSGPRAHILGLVGGLRHRGHAVTMYVLGDHMPARVSARGSQGSSAAGAVRRLGVDSVRLGMRRAVARRARAALVEPVDVVYERFALFQEMGRTLKSRGAVWVVESNAIMSQEAKQEHNALALQRLAARLERRTYHAADLVVSVSHPLKEMLTSQLDVPPDKILVLPNGVDIDRFPPGAPPAGDALRDGEVVVGFVGFVVERQGLDDLVRAVARLRRRHVGVRATIVGDGPDLPRLRQLVEAEDVKDGVDFRGQVPWSAVPEEMARFCVGYSGQRGVGGMPMYHSPLKIYEYMAMGRPVLAADHGDAQRVLRDTGVGWTFRAGDVQDLTRSLAEVAALQASQLSELGRRARRHVEEHHTWAHRADALLTEVRRLGLVD